MTYTSFNPIHLQQTSMQTNQPLQLKQGQVFHGTVKQLYPDQMAEIQVGKQKMFAELEIPLKAGDAHYFQATNTNPQTELKVVSEPMASTLSTSQQIQTLMESLRLPKSNEMHQVLAHFVKSGLPLSKEQLVQAETWLKSLPNGVTKHDALLALQRMAEGKVPFTNNVFQAFVYGSKTEGMSYSIQQLIQQLQSDSTLPNSAKTNILTQLQQIQTPFDGEKGGLMLARSIQTLLNPSESMTSKFQALTFLKQSAVLSDEVTISNWQQSLQSQATSEVGPSMNRQQAPVSRINAGQLIQLIGSDIHSNPQILQQVKEWISSQQLLTQSQKSELYQFIQQFEGTNKNGHQLSQFTSQFQQQLINMFADNTVSQLFTQDPLGVSSKDQLISLFKHDVSLTNSNAMLRNIVKISNDSIQPFVQSLLTETDVTLQSAIDHKSIAQAVKSLLSHLGVSYEAQLNNKATNIQEVAQSLKPQLISLVQDPQTPAVLREAAEQVIARMNGMQLLSGENGHQHQLIMQLPLSLFGKQMDATLQWNGRMKDDGKIDADFARILFYLNMEALHETMIDMQVQNRIVTLNIYNDSKHVELLAEPLKQSLKNALHSMDYQLSGVIIKPFKNDSAVIGNVKVTKDDKGQQVGVDIRI